MIVTGKPCKGFFHDVLNSMSIVIKWKEGVTKHA